MDLIGARTYFKLAPDQDYAPAQLRYGICWERGLAARQLLPLRSNSLNEPLNHELATLSAGLGSAWSLDEAVRKMSIEPRNATKTLLPVGTRAHRPTLDFAYSTGLALK
jgi:hypothetical protein